MGRPLTSWSFARLVHVISSRRRLLEPGADGPDDRLAEGLLSPLFVHVGEKPSVHGGVIDELNLQQAEGGIAHVRVLPRVAENPEAVLAVIGVRDHQSLLRLPAEGLECLRNFASYQ